MQVQILGSTQAFMKFKNNSGFHEVDHNDQAKLTVSGKKYEKDDDKMNTSKDNDLKKSWKKTLGKRTLP